MEYAIIYKKLQSVAFASINLGDVFMHRFFADGITDADKSYSIVGEDVNHIRNVLRLKVGDEIIIMPKNDNIYDTSADSLDAENRSNREYHAVISEISQTEVVCDIVDICDNNAELPVRITLFQGMPKADKMEFIIQKACELGAFNIVPVMTKRTVVKLEPKKEKRKLERFNLIAESAAKQSGRGIIPEVLDFMTFGEALNMAKDMDMILIPYENAKGIAYSREVIEEIKGVKSVGIFIGPEGGFAKEEVDKAVSMGGKAITLGNRILRTETAGLAILSIIGFAIE